MRAALRYHPIRVQKLGPAALPGTQPEFRRDESPLSGGFGRLSVVFLRTGPGQGVAAIVPAAGATVKGCGAWCAGLGGIERRRGGRRRLHGVGGGRIA